MAHLSLDLLGQLQITLDGAPLADLATDKARALLVYLAIEADRLHRREALAGLLWPDQPQRKAGQNLRQALLYLRQALSDRAASQFLLITRETIQFCADGDYALDVATFARLSRACQDHRHSGLGSCIPCLRRLEQMAEMYHGEFLAQFYLDDSSAFEEWAVLKREWLHRLAMEALDHLANYYERRGDWDRARRYAWRQVELEPWREEAHRQLMRLLAMDGQRSTALSQYQACRKALARELGVEPTAETMALYESIRAGDRLDSPAGKCHLPPSPTCFVGREKELGELAELLSDPDCRLVTLIGPGGIGKSRLALQSAMAQVGAFAHGVHWVPLAPAGSYELMVAAIAGAIEFPFSSCPGPQEQLLNHMREKHMLLVLDNLEHLLNPPGGGGTGATTLLARLLQLAPGVKLLVTSRERLNLREEWLYQVTGLTYPDSPLAGEPPEAAMQAYSATALFVRRARQVTQDFAPSRSEASSIARICQLVEGMPLGIELAAAWVAMRSCADIAHQIERNLDILTSSLHNVPERQQSVWATFEHSWQLLSEKEQELFARLSVFRGGFDLDAAMAVAGATPSALAALLDKSLIRHVPPDRYNIHGLLRQYAAGQLAARPQERQETRRQHARYFAGWMARQAAQLEGAQQKQVLIKIGLEIENARQAWEMAVTQGRTQEVEQCLECLYHFYETYSRFQEGIEVLAQAIDRWDGEWPAHIAGQIMSHQGALYRHLGLYSQAQTGLERGLAIAERHGAPAERLFCRVHLANVAYSQGRHREAERLAHESLELSRQNRDRWGAASSLFLLGLARYRAGEVDEAEALLQESLAIGRESGNNRLVIAPLNTLGDIACHRGDLAKGRSLFQECLALSRELGDPYSTAVHLNNLGTVLHTLGEFALARPLYQESLDICHNIGDRVGQAVALSNLGEIAFALGAHAEARQFYLDGLAIGRSVQDQWTTMVNLNNLGEVACALENYESARAYLAEAMHIASQTQTWTMLTKVLVNLAVLFARTGLAHQAAELLELARRHPASEQDIQKKAGRLLDELGLAAPETVGTLESVVARMAADWGAPAGQWELTN